MPMKVNKGGRPTAVGCDIFAGGFTCGVAKHFDVLMHLEHGPYGVKTSQINFPGMPIYHGKEAWPERLNGRQPVDFIYANPPCAVWSVANNRRGDTWRDDPRTNCIHDVVGLLKHKPKVLAWESTTNAWTKGAPLVRQLADVAMDAGYAVTHCLHDGMYLGLPQHRKRYFYIAHKVELEWPTKLMDPIPVGQVLKKLKKPGKALYEPSSSFVKLWKTTAPGRDLRASMSISQQNDPKFRKPGFFVRKVPINEPAHTVITAELMHHSDPRFLSFAEFKAICNYPEWFELAGGPTTGNMSELFRAVMPSTGEWLAKIVKRGIEAGRKVKPVEHMVDLRKPDEIVIRPNFRQPELPL